MEDLSEAVSSIIREIMRIQKSDEWIHDEDDNFPLPRFISAGRDQHIRITKRIDRDILSIAKIWRKRRHPLSNRFSDKILASEVRSCIGQFLTEIDLTSPFDFNVSYIVQKVELFLEEYSKRELNLEYIFGCHLFSNESALTTFSIGSLEIHQRSIWLKKALRNELITLVTFQRILKIWDGVKLRKRKPSHESMIEDEIISTVGQCSYICEVNIFGHPNDSTDQRALMAARLFLTFVSLCWSSPSRALASISLAYDRDLYHQQFVCFSQGELISANSQKSMMKGGTFLQEKNWNFVIKDFYKNFKIYAEILEFLTAQEGQSRRVNLMSTLCQSVLWFHEACREKSDVIAVVKYSASMDALACGNKSKGILKILENRVGLYLNARFLEDGTTAKQVLNYIYWHGRSDTIHGNNIKFNHDWSEMRYVSQVLARLCILHCTEWCYENSSVTRPMDMQKA